MKIAKHYRPELVVSKGKEPNPLLTDPYLDSEAERLISTNGHGLVALPVETEKDERSRYLACNLLKAARSMGAADIPAEIDDQEVVEYGVLWPTAQERTFPEWKKLIPKFKRGSPGTFTFALDPALLSRMANAMGLGGVCLTVELGRPEGQPSPIIVQPLNDRGEELGLLMPMDANGAGEGVSPECVCPACGKLLAAGAPCPKHGSPAEAKRALLEGDADVILKNGGSAHLTKGSGGIDSTTITLKMPGRPDVTTTPEKLKAVLDELERRKTAKKGGRS